MKKEGSWKGAGGGVAKGWWLQARGLAGEKGGVRRGGSSQQGRGREEGERRCPNLCHVIAPTKIPCGITNLVWQCQMEFCLPRMRLCNRD